MSRNDPDTGAPGPRFKDPPTRDLSPTRCAAPAADGWPVRVAPIAASVALLWLPVLALHLTPAIFAALITYGGTRAVARLLLRLRPTLTHVQAWALVLLVGVSAAAISVIVERTAEAAAEGGGYAALLQQMASALDQVRSMLPAWLAAHVPASLDAVRQGAVAWLRIHAEQVQLWGGHTVRGLGYALAGIVIGALLALQLPVRPTGEAAGSLRQASRRYFDDLVDSFSAIVFAQLRIAAVNTALTGVYLLVILPAAGMALPLAGTLVVATFVASLVPIVGNLVSNTMIVVVSLTNSVALAGLSLAWLVAIHKLEYFLNAHIIGGRIRSRAWELLISMLALEASFGLAGLISAPVIYAQIKHALHERGWL